MMGAKVMKLVILAQTVRSNVNTFSFTLVYKDWGLKGDCAVLLNFEDYFDLTSSTLIKTTDELIEHMHQHLHKRLIREGLKNITKLCMVFDKN